MRKIWEYDVPIMEQQFEQYMEDVLERGEMQEGKMLAALAESATEALAGT